MSLAKKTAKIDNNSAVRLDPVAHILLRPDAYVGSKSLTEDKEYYITIDGDNIVANYGAIKYSPVLLKIFDEILVNACDACDVKSKNNNLYVTVTEDYISVRNTGSCIPIEQRHLITKDRHGNKTQSEAVEWYPTMLFSELNYSTNFDDNVERITGGRNGLGAKLTNIFSNKFVILCDDTKVQFKQSFINNMNKDQDALVVKSKSKTPFVEIGFSYDKKNVVDSSVVNEFDVTETLYMVYKRTVDVAGFNKFNKVYLNGIEITKKIKSFVDLIKFYNPDTTSLVKLESETESVWDVYCTIDDNVPAGLSYVNSIATKRGTHIDIVVDAIKKQFEASLKESVKDANVLKIINRKIICFINSTVINPSFTSQTKTHLNTSRSDFKKSYMFTLNPNSAKPLIKDMKVAYDSIYDNTLREQADKSLSKKKTDSNSMITDIKGLRDACYAGTDKSEKCCLILTEGESAAGSCSSGLSKLPNDERNYYGLYSMRGKVLNVSDVSFSKFTENAVIKEIVTAMGLTYDKNTKRTPRYGRIIIMTDQDPDGSHIKGLILNLFNAHWPEYIRSSNIKQFITPLVKIFNSKKKCISELFSMKEFEEYKQKNPNANFTHAYYKGLGTSSAKEFGDYFQSKETYIKDLNLSNEDDKLFSLCFDKDTSDDRKEWLSVIPDPDQYPDNTINKFLNVDLHEYSLYSINRAIPSVFDGLKPSQRKAMYCAIKNLKDFKKVAVFTSEVMTETQYHHGDVSLSTAIVAMAKWIPNTNNLPYLQGRGNFGTRINAEAGSPRYTYISTPDYMRYVFKKEDLDILTYNYDNDDKLEPVFLIPVIPTVLVNGALGIATGWKAEVPSFNPIDVINASLDYLHCIKNKKPFSIKKSLVPWYRYYNAVIEEVDNKFIINPNYTIDNNKTYSILKVNEIPLGSSADEWFTRLLEVLKESDIGFKRPINLIKQFNNNSIYLEVSLNKVLNQNDHSKVFKFLNNTTTLTTSNMNLINQSNTVSSYNSINSIISTHGLQRLKCYSLRKVHILKELQLKLLSLTNIIKYIQQINNNKINIKNKSDSELTTILETNNYSKIDNSYYYILSKPISILSKENYYKEQYNKLLEEYKRINSTTEYDMWYAELIDLKKCIESFDFETCFGINE